MACVSAEGVTQIFEHPTGRYHVQVTEGNQQSAPVNSWFAQPLGVRVTDSLGAPVAGVEVRYLPGARKGPSARPQGPWVGTDREGNAAMNVQTSPLAGSYSMLANGTKGASATFSLTGTP